VECFIAALWLVVKLSGGKVMKILTWLKRDMAALMQISNAVKIVQKSTKSMTTLMTLASKIVTKSMINALPQEAIGKSARYRRKDAQLESVKHN
jgi:hypothetical protein